MDKIVPSLLYNMQHARYYDEGFFTEFSTNIYHLKRPRRMSNAENSSSGQPEEQGDSETGNRTMDPSALAENCLRELVGRASFGNIRSVIKPVFR